MKILTTQQASAEFHVSVALIQRWTERGLLETVAPGQYLDLAVARTEAKTRRTARWRQLAQLAVDDEGNAA